MLTPSTRNGIACDGDRHEHRRPVGDRRPVEEVLEQRAQNSRRDDDEDDDGDADIAPRARPRPSRLARIAAPLSGHVRRRPLAPSAASVANRLRARSAVYDRASVVHHTDGQHGREMHAAHRTYVTGGETHA